MKRTDLPDRFQELLRSIPYVTIATVGTDGQPWNTPLVGHFDDAMNLYFVTAKDSQHGKNIAHEPRIFAAIYDSQATLGSGEGLYLKMRAEALSSSLKIDEARRVSGMHFTENIPDHPDFLGDCPRRMYKAVPEQIWYNADGEWVGHGIDIRVELTGQK